MGWWLMLGLAAGRKFGEMMADAAGLPDSSSLAWLTEAPAITHWFHGISKDPSSFSVDFIFNYQMEQTIAEWERATARRFDSSFQYVWHTMAHGFLYSFSTQKADQSSDGGQARVIAVIHLRADRPSASLVSV